MSDVINVMDLAIEVMNAERRIFSHMAACVTVMLNMEVLIEHMRIKDLHGTKGEVFLQNKKIY